MGSYFELWTRPGHPNFGRVIDDPPFRQATIHGGVNLLGDGTMQMPNNFDRFDDILKIAGASSVSSLVRVRSDIDDSVTFEWVVRALVPTSDKNDPYEDVSGRSMMSVLEYAKTAPFDWDGSDDWVCQDCDWVWGGANLISNPGFENSGDIPTIYQVYTDATGGTFTLSDGTDTTSAIAFDASASTIETRLEIDITAITDVIVGGTGVEDDPWVVEFKNPAFGITLTANFGGLTGGSGFITRTQEGGRDPAPAMKSQTISTGVSQIYGAYDAFEVTDAQAHTGTYSLLIDPAPVPPRYAGVQWVVRVVPGSVYQASIWVRPTSGTDTYRFVIRAPGGGAGSVGGEGLFIASDTGGLGQTSYAANTWTEVTIDDIVIPDGITEIIVRFANTNATGNPAPFYVDDVSLIAGMRATTPGEIIRLLYEHATDPLLRSPIVWDDGQGTDTPYLTLDFTDALDSAGVAWAHSELRIYVYMRMSLYQVLLQLSSMVGIEFRVVPDDVENGTWKLQAYNKGGMGSVQDVAIQGGSSDVRRLIRRFLPNTDYMVEGRERVTARAADTALRTALGRMESARLDRELPGEEAVQDAAAEDAADAEVSVEPWSYELVDPQDQPLTAYREGDEIAVHDPPEADGQARLWEYVATFTPERETWEVDLLPEGT